MYQVFYLYPNNYFLVINRSENKHSGWRNPIPDYLSHSIPKPMRGSTDNTLAYLQNVNSFSKIYYLGEYESVLDFYTINPHFLI